MVVVAVEVVFGAEVLLLDGDDLVVLGTTTVTVTLGVVVVTLVPVPDLVGVVPVPDLVGAVPVPDLGGAVPVPDLGEVLVVVPGWNAAYSTVWAGAE